MSIILVCEDRDRAAHTNILGGQKLVVNAAQRLSLINSLDTGSLHYINQQRGGTMTV